MVAFFLVSQDSFVFGKVYPARGYCFFAGQKKEMARIQFFRAHCFAKVAQAAFKSLNLMVRMPEITGAQHLGRGAVFLEKPALAFAGAAVGAIFLHPDQCGNEFRGTVV
jgi:hypothetical protein